MFVRLLFNHVCTWRKHVWVSFERDDTRNIAARDLSAEAWIFIYPSRRLFPSKFTDAWYRSCTTSGSQPSRVSYARLRLRLRRIIAGEELSPSRQEVLLLQCRAISPIHDEIRGSSSVEPRLWISQSRENSRDRIDGEYGTRESVRRKAKRRK